MFIYTIFLYFYEIRVQKYKNYLRYKVITFIEVIFIIFAIYFYNNSL